MSSDFVVPSNEAFLDFLSRAVPRTEDRLSAIQSEDFFVRYIARLCYRFSLLDGSALYANVPNYFRGHDQLDYITISSIKSDAVLRLRFSKVPKTQTIKVKFLLDNCTVEDWKTISTMLEIAISSFELEQNKEAQIHLYDAFFCAELREFLQSLTAFFASDAWLACGANKLNELVAYFAIGFKSENLEDFKNITQAIKDQNNDNSFEMAFVIDGSQVFYVGSRDHCASTFQGITDFVERGIDVSIGTSPDYMLTPGIKTRELYVSPGEAFSGTLMFAEHLLQDWFQP